MVLEIRIPCFYSIDDEQEEDIITMGKWYKREGDFIKKGDILFEVETMKALFEVDCKDDGYLRKIIHDENSEVKLGDIVGIITTSKDEPAIFDQTTRLPTDKVSIEKESISGIRDNLPLKSKSVKASPRARRLALAHGIDISVISPSGPHGEITIMDVEKFLSRTGDKTSERVRTKSIISRLRRRLKIIRGILSGILLPFTIRLRLMIPLANSYSRKNQINILNKMLLECIDGNLTVDILKRYGAYIGERTVFMANVIIINAVDDYSNLKIGTHVHIGRDVCLDLSEKLTVEDEAIIAVGATIFTHRDTGGRFLEYHFPSIKRVVRIGKGAWIGPRAVVYPGVSVGKGSVIMAGSIVNMDVPGFAIVAGMPAQKIGTIPSPTQ